MLNAAIRSGVGRRGPAITTKGKAVPARLLATAAAEHAQVVVVGVVLHHQDQEVVNLGEGVRPLRQARKR